MITNYTYELWNGKRVIGHYTSFYPVLGNFLVIPEVSILKQYYNRKISEITIPVVVRIVSDNKIDITLRRVLDVRRKSNRQIKVILLGSK